MRLLIGKGDKLPRLIFKIKIFDHIKYVYSIKIQTTSGKPIKIKKLKQKWSNKHI